MSKNLDDIKLEIQQLAEVGMLATSGEEYSPLHVLFKKIVDKAGGIEE